MKIKYALLLSLLIHFTALAIWVKGHPEQKQNLDQQQEEQQQRQTGTKAYPGTIIDIVPQLNPGMAPKKELKDFFWGIGVTCNQGFDQIDGTTYWVIEVKIVHDGYSAQETGVLAGDKIYLIDNEPIKYGSNDIAGKGPRKMILTILRGNSTITKSIERVKVYF